MSSNYQFTNNAATTLASGILAGATSLTVATGTGALFPSLSGGNFFYCTLQKDRKSTRLNSSHSQQSRMPSSA